MKGYYYYGYVDERDKKYHEKEEEYYYNMDKHFQEYHKNSFIIAREENEKDVSYLEYFESLGGLRLYSISSEGIDLENGDYIHVFINTPIKETYPAKVGKPEVIEVLYPRNP